MAAVTATPNRQSETQSEVNTLFQEESKIVASLAELQNLHEKLQDLRDLLPGQVLEPLHIAPLISSKEPNDSISPQSVFINLSKAVKRGEDQLKDFKSLWQSDNMERARKRARVEYIGQGDDVFREDYRETETGFKRREEAIKKRKEEKEKDFDPDEGRVDSEEPKVILERWGKKKEEGKAQVRIENVVDGEGEEAMRFDVWTGGLKLSVQSRGEGSTRQWTVQPREGTEFTHRRADSIRCLNARRNKRSLEYLLDMLEAYWNICGGRKGACETCDRLIGRGGGDPVVRKRKKTVDDKGNVNYIWGTYHEEQCCWGPPDEKKS